MKNHMQFYIQNIKLRIKMETKRNFKKCFKMYIDNLVFFYSTSPLHIRHPDHKFLFNSAIPVLHQIART